MDFWYDNEWFTSKNQLFKKNQVVNPAIIVDVSHDNCVIDGVKDHNEQANIVLRVIESLKKQPELKNLVKGFMLESFIKEGRQNAESGNPIDMSGLSITDPCLSWESTAKLILQVAKQHSKG